jgi:hypothetical protein
LTGLRKDPDASGRIQDALNDVNFVIIKPARR